MALLTPTQWFGSSMGSRTRQLMLQNCTYVFFLATNQKIQRPAKTNKNTKFLGDPLDDTPKGSQVRCCKIKEEDHWQQGSKNLEISKKLQVLNNKIFCHLQVCLQGLQQHRPPARLGTKTFILRGENI